MSRAEQSLRVYYQKFVNAWPLVLRHSPRLLWRFIPRGRRATD
ncbi:MAG: hypothetical protein ACREQF_08935 [Candidatus Binataceae bacterium]